MSAFICSSAHITAIAAAAVELGVAEREIATAKRKSGVLDLAAKIEAARDVAESLHTINVAAVNTRYRTTEEDESFEFCEKTAKSLLSGASAPYRTTYPAVRLMKAIQCYEYQASEVADWSKSEARGLLREVTERLVCFLPGYAEAAWGWSSEGAR